MTRWIGYCGLLLLALLWGTMVPTVSYLLQVWDSMFLAMFRYAGAAPLMWVAFTLASRSRHAVSNVGHVRPGWRLWLLGFVGITMFAALYTFGVQHCHPVTAAILSATSPAIAALVDRVAFGIPLDRRMLPAIILAIIGCALATVRFDSGSMFDFRGGEILMVLATACWSWYSTAAQRWCYGWSQLRITAATMTTGGIGLIVIYALTAMVGVIQFPPATDVDTSYWAVLGWMTVVLCAFGVYLWNFGVKRTGVVVASLYLNLVPVVALTIFAFWGLVPTWPQILGGVLVIAGVVLSELGLLKAKKIDPTLNAAQPT